MGMMERLTGRWRARQDEMLHVQPTASAMGGYTALIKTLNFAMQSAAITTGALLAIAQEITPGLIIGAALLLSKTLQPIQQAVSSWKSFVDAREQYLRLNDVLEAFPPEDKKLPLPDIDGHIVARNAFVVPPGGETPTLLDISFALSPGSTTMIVGASAAGKSTLVRAILGLWPTSKGRFVLMAPNLSILIEQNWPQIGYLPQDIELFDGSIAENIARFGDLDPELVIQAASDAGVHDIILALPQGYDTVISGLQGLLSPGQRQRVALARALYGRPKLLVLDEPNSNLDEAGERALTTALVNMKGHGSTILMVSHRQQVLSLADYVIVLEAGRVKLQGTRDEVVAAARAAQEAAQAAQAGSNTQLEPQGA